MTVTVRFFAAGGPSSGVELSGLGTYDYSYIGFYGASGFGDTLGIGEAQSYTWMSSSGASPISGMIPAGGQLMNNKWIDATGVSVSGGDRVDLSTIQASGSGTILIRVSDDSTDIYCQNARLYAYDGVSVGNAPSGVWILSYEIISADQSGLGDSSWALIDNSNYNYFVDRTAVIGYPAQQTRDYTVGLSVRPKATASNGIQPFGFYFLCEVI